MADNCTGNQSKRGGFFWQSFSAYIFYRQSVFGVSDLLKWKVSFDDKTVYICV